MKTARWQIRSARVSKKTTISCWIAPRDIPPGQEWATAITAALRSCRSLLLLLSSHSNNSKQIAREVQLADRNGLKIVTFRLEPVEAPPSLEYFLTNLQWIDGFGGRFEPALNSVVETVRQTIVLPAIPAPQESTAERVDKRAGTQPTLAARPAAVPASAAVFDGPELERLKKVLAEHLGAVARVVVDRAAQHAASWDQLYKTLSDEIPPGEARKRFLASRQR